MNILYSYNFVLCFDVDCDESSLKIWEKKTKKKLKKENHKHIPPSLFYSTYGEPHGTRLC